MKLESVQTRGQSAFSKTYELAMDELLDSRDILLQDRVTPFSVEPPDLDELRSGEYELRCAGFLPVMSCTEDAIVRANDTMARSCVGRLCVGRAVGCCAGDGG